MNVGHPIAATDPEKDTLAYTVAGTDAASFEIDEDSGQLSTKASVTYDFETKPSYALTVTVSDGAHSVSIPVTVDLTDVNDAPIFSDGESATRSLPENSAANVNLGAPFTATDEDGHTLAYSLSGTDAAAFAIDSETGQLSTQAGATYDFETKPTLTLTVTATDTGTPALSDTLTVTVSLTDVNEPPAFSDGDSATRDVPENSAANVNVGDPISATDPEEDTFTYTLTGADAASFNFNTATGQLSTKTGVTYDRETKATYAVTVTAIEDGDTSLATSIPVTVTLTNVNEPPVFSAETYEFSVAEDASRFTLAGSVAAADPDEGDTLAYSITAGNTGGKFAIVRNTGEIVVVSPLSFVTTSTYTLKVKVIEDLKPAALSDTATVTVNVFSAIDRYRQVRSWTGRNLDNSADVTLTTISSWSTTSPPSSAPNITSKTTTETRDDDDKVRKTITWTDGTTNAYQRTAWYKPTRTETYYETEYYWTDENYTVTEYRRCLNGYNVPLQRQVDLCDHWTEDNPPPPIPYGHIINVVERVEERQAERTRRVRKSRQVERTRTVTVTPVYTPSSGPTENQARTESAPRE